MFKVAERLVCAKIMLLVPALAMAASFDCSKAVTRVEALICGAKALSELDSQLAETYRAAGATSSEQAAAVKRQQREWLRNVRDKCDDETCLTNAYRQRLYQLTSMKPAKWNTFRDSRLGIEFSYPGNREVMRGCRGSNNCVALTSEWTAHSEYLIAFEVFEGDLERTAAAHTVFEKTAEKIWIAAGRSGRYAAVPLAGLGWQGLKATVDCGISDHSGFHAAGGECLWAVMSNGRRSVVADTQGIVGNDEVSLRSIQSLRFLE